MLKQDQYVNVWARKAARGPRARNGAAAPENGAGGATTRRRPERPTKRTRRVTRAGTPEARSAPCWALGLEGSPLMDREMHSHAEEGQENGCITNVLWAATNYESTPLRT